MHSQIEFSGTPLEFAHALYLERFKRGTPWAGFFPTPAWLADQAAALLGFHPGQVVLDPGCGFGSLSQAVERHGGIPVMVEYSNAVVPIAQALWGEERVHYADFTDGFRPPKFDAVITNPSFGKVFGHSDAALCHLTHSFAATAKLCFHLANDVDDLSFPTPTPAAPDAMWPELRHVGWNRGPSSTTLREPHSDKHLVYGVERRLAALRHNVGVC